MEKLKGGVAFNGSEGVGGVVSEFEKFVYGGEESFVVGGAGLNELGLVGVAGCGESMPVLLNIVLGDGQLNQFSLQVF